MIDNQGLGGKTPTLNSTVRYVTYARVPVEQRKKMMAGVRTRLVRSLTKPLASGEPVAPPTLLDRQATRVPSYLALPGSMTSFDVLEWLVRRQPI